jgi:hypothetical protein
MPTHVTPDDLPADRATPDPTRLADRPRRIRPVTHEVTAQIIAAPPAPGAPQIAPDIARPIDPGPVLGVTREPSDEVTGHPDPHPDDSFDPHLDDCFDRRLESDLDPGRDADAANVWTWAGLTPALVIRLQTVRGYPCVSLLLSTRPAARMDREDAERLERLRLGALSRLRAEHRLDADLEIVAALDRLMQAAMSAPTDRAIALYAGPDVAQAVVLPIEVEDRTVIDPTFATKDLVRALHRTPRHVVLTLSPRRAALFDGAGGRLAPAAGTRFPMDLHLAPGYLSDARNTDRSSQTVDSGEDVKTDGDQHLPSALRAVDRGLGTYLRLHPAPVILAGPQTIVTTFHRLSRNMARLAGTVYGGFDDTDPSELARRTRPILNRYLASREHAALALVEQRGGQQRVASGIATAWLAARTERPEMLVVEEGYSYPARLSADGDHVTAADDIHAPDVIDDLVDELIETVLDRGGWVALARDGTLTDHDGVALTLR